jgi:hypothetical protein
VPKKALKLKYFHNTDPRRLPAKTKKPTSVSDLLDRGQGLLGRLREGTAEADRALAALRRSLPPELADKVWAATAREGTLTVFVRSAAWGTRIRYLAPRIIESLATELGTGVERIKVKVRAGRQ